MEGPLRKPLRLWENAALTIFRDRPSASYGRAGAGPHYPREFAQRLFADETLRARSFSPSIDEFVEPYTLQWFLDIENQRHSRQGRWIPRLMEFSKHAGETLLGLGNGLGTDWLQYARHGAAVVVCSPAAEQLSLARRNFELRGLNGRFVHTSATSLPLETASIDVACLSSLLHEVDDPRAVVHEVFRVLKPGGKVLAVAPARYDVDFWYRRCFPWTNWLSPQQPPSDTPQQQFSARGLRKLFGDFIEHRVHKRQLRRSEVPHIWRWLPLSLLERMLGRVLVLKAFKPLSCAASLQKAA